MSNHTPGPWKLLPASGYRRTAARHGDKAIVGANKITPAIVFGGYSEAEADARLIAAAPDLLAALEWALQYGTFDVATDNPMHGRALDKAKALVKAGGQS